MFTAVVLGYAAMVALALFFAWRDGRRRERQREWDRWVARRRPVDIDLVADELASWRDRERLSPLDREVWR